MFNPHQEEVASGFPIDPPRPSQASVEESSNDHLQKRASHSGPLVHRASKISTGPDLSKPDVHKLMGRYPGSFKEASDQRSQTVTGSTQNNDDGRTGNKDPVLLGYGSKGSKIHYSGPLLVPSGKVDQMLKEHDRQIQEAARRSRLDKAKVRNQLFVSGR